MIRLNKEQILKQQRQVINNAYTHISYILKECRPFLKGYIQGQYGLLKTHTRFLFQTLPKTLNGELEPISVPLDSNGRWVVFPTGEFDIVDEHVIMDVDLEEGLDKPDILVNVLKDAIDNNRTIDLLCPKIFTLELNMFKSIETSLKNTFTNLLKLETT